MRSSGVLLCPSREVSEGKGVRRILEHVHMPQSLTSPSVIYVRDIMTTPVHTVDMDDPILSVKLLFDRERCHHVVVLRRNRVFGVVSDRDILKTISPFVGNRMMERSQDLNTLKKRVHQIMSRDPVTVGPDEAIPEAAEKMLSERVSCLPVVDDGRSPVGIVTIRDFVAWAVGTSSVCEEYPDEFEHDKGILVIIDGARCYSPHVAIGRLIREAERSYEDKYGAGSARAKCLPSPRMKQLRARHRHDHPAPPLPA